MPWLPKVGRHCAYLQQKTYDGNADYVKRRPAIVTEIAADDNPVLRVGHTGEVYGDSTTGVPPREHPDDDTVDVYVTY